MAAKYPFLDLGPVNAPYMDDITAAMERIVRGGRYVGGAEVEQLEANLCRLTGASHAVAVSNGLDALRLILRGYVELGALKPGDEVIVPANTYIASVLAITDAGLRPVLVDPEEATSNLDVERVAEALTPRTRAIMPVHLYGRVCWSEALAAIARDNNLLVVEDNAQAIGAVTPVAGLHGQHTTGALGHAAGFSFYPTKNIGAMGDAGAVTTSDAELARVVRALANYGGDRRYHNVYCGFNCRMDPLQAAVLNVKLPHIDEENELRRNLADIYLSGIDNPEVRLPQRPATRGEHVYHQFVVHVDDREAFIRHLDANGVGWDCHYAVPPHRQPCYADTLGRGAHLPVTEQLGDTCVSLPITRCTSVDDVAAIVGIINCFRNN